VRLSPRDSSMTEQTARTVANLVIGAAALGAAYIILRTPSLRRMAAGLSFAALTGGLPAWVSQEVQRAWNASSQDDGSGRAAGLATSRSDL
jgi:hypothetical protein